MNQFGDSDANNANGKAKKGTTPPGLEICTSCAQSMGPSSRYKVVDEVQGNKMIPSKRCIFTRCTRMYRPHAA